MTTPPSKLGSRSFRTIAWVLSHSRYALAFTILVMLEPWIGVVTAFGILKPQTALIGAAIVLGVVLVLTLFIPIGLRVLRFNALRREIEKAIPKLPINSNTCLVGAGGGSFIAIGVILKYWQAYRGLETPPSSVCVSLHNDGSERHFDPPLAIVTQAINKPHVLLVVATIGTGRMIAELTAWANGIPNVTSVDVFSLLVSREAEKGTNLLNVHTLAVLDREDGARSIIPWERTSG